MANLLNARKSLGLQAFYEISRETMLNRFVGCRSGNGMARVAPAALVNPPLVY
jgi:hypothetical protein